MNRDELKRKRKKTGTECVRVFMRENVDTEIRDNLSVVWIASFAEPQNI